MGAVPMARDYRKEYSTLRVQYALPLPSRRLRTYSTTDQGTVGGAPFAFTDAPHVEFLGIDGLLSVLVKLNLTSAHTKLKLTEQMEVVIFGSSGYRVQASGGVRAFCGLFLL